MGGYWCRSDLIELPERASRVAAVGLFLVFSGDTLGRNLLMTVRPT